MEYESECRTSAGKRKTKKNNAVEAGDKVEKDDDDDISAGTISEGQTDAAITKTLTRRSTIKLLESRDTDTNSV